MKKTDRWYQFPFVWMLIALPLTAVVGSFVSLALAIHSDDGLVEDDYYKRGMEINRQLDRDKAAAAHGLTSTLDFDDAHHELRVRLAARQAIAWPDNITLKLMHATRGGLDKTALLPRQSDGSYRMPLPDLAPGHWDVQIAAQDWRLTGSLFVPRGERVVLLRPVLP